MTDKKPKRDLQSVLLKPISRLRRREKFLSPSADKMGQKLGLSITKAAISKCLDFNVLANKKSVHKNNAFILVANLRGICEDLIVLKFISSLSESEQDEYFSLMQQYNLRSGILVQAQFFENNNPFQPIAGSNIPEAEHHLENVTLQLKQFWKNLGKGTRGPTVRSMADDSGLSTTYEYIYFLSSNFVHFNPHTLLRTGWGPMEGPFEISVHNMNGYYADLTSFYGALLLIGFHSVFSESCFSDQAREDISQLVDILDHAPRWPELITYEELNQRPPMLHFISRAMRKVAQQEGEPYKYGEILREVGVSLKEK